MTLNTRSVQLAAYRTAEAQITALFAALIERITGILVREGDDDGKIPLRNADTVRDTVRQVVQGYFVQQKFASISEREIELEHLNTLIDLARAELNTATDRQRQRVLGRLGQLTDRLNLLAGGVVLEAFTRYGDPITDYARVVHGATYGVTAAVVDAHAGMMTEALVGYPELLTALSVPPNAIAASQVGGVLTWTDTRGYALSDRIWNVSEATAARIDAILGDGIMQGRAAVDIAKDLERYLSPSRRVVKTLKPYGTQGSFDARRLARTEITRAHALAQDQAYQHNPFVVRVRYHLSQSHDPRNCDGTCDDHYAEDQANDGFEPGSAPIPGVDTHPQCTCYTTGETGPLEPVIDNLNVRISERQQHAPFTPLARAAFIAWLMGTLNQPDVTRTVSAG